MMKKEALKLMSHPISRAIGGGLLGSFIASKVAPPKMGVSARLEKPWKRTVNNALRGAIVAAGVMGGLNYGSRSLTRGLKGAAVIGGLLGASSPSNILR